MRSLHLHIVHNSPFADAYEHIIHKFALIKSHILHFMAIYFPISYMLFSVFVGRDSLNQSDKTNFLRIPHMHYLILLYNAIVFYVICV